MPNKYIFNGNYNQNDYLESYGYGTTIKSDGCGPVAMAMVLSTLKGGNITPVEFICVYNPDV